MKILNWTGCNNINIEDLRVFPFTACSISNFSVRKCYKCNIGCVKEIIKCAPLITYSTLEYSTVGCMISDQIPYYRITLL